MRIAPGMDHRGAVPGGVPPEHLPAGRHQVRVAGGSGRAFRVVGVRLASPFDGGRRERRPGTIAAIDRGESPQAVRHAG